MSKLNKRKYKAVIEKLTGKWFTGYSEEYLTEGSDNDYWNRRYPLCQESNEHVTMELSLKYSTYERGRSAATIVMVDQEGYRYELTLSSFDKLMTASNDPFNETVSLNANGWFIGTFMQMKQG